MSIVKCSSEPIPKKPMGNKKDFFTKLIGIITIGSGLTYLIDGFDFHWQTAASTFLYTTLYWEGCWRITTYYHKRFNTYQSTPQRIFYQILAITIYVLIMNAVVLGVIVTLIYPDYHFRFQMYVGNLVISLVVTYLIGAIFEALNFFSLWKQAQKESAIFKEEHLKAQLETLKNQVNPHFLFNSLNTLSAIIPEDPDKAVEFVQHLSQLYRYSLQHREKNTVALHTELECIRSYLYLQAMRFGDKLSWKIAVDNRLLDHQLPPLSLQLLVENAVKHNVISADAPLEISISNLEDRLIIVNNFQAKRSVEPSTQVGLNNLRERYRILGHNTVEVKRDTDKFEVSIPLIPAT